MKCKLDGEMKTEVEFSPENASSVRVLAVMENEYTISVKAPSKMDWVFLFLFFFPPSPSPLLPFYLNLPVLRNTGGIRVKSAMQKNFSPEKSQNYILTCHTFDEELRETAACGFCFPLSSSRVARWKHLGGSSENRLQLLEHFELSCVLWAPPY